MAQESFPESLALALDNYGPTEAIWMVENEAARKIKNLELVEVIYREADGIISDFHISNSVKALNIQLSQLNLMLLHAPTMEVEEWILAITILSTCYCTHIFACRRGFAVERSGLYSAMEMLKDCTSNFQDSRFRRALISARKHNPNPLPSPL